MIRRCIPWPDPRLAVVDASQERGQAVRMANPGVLHVSGQSLYQTG